MDGNVTLNPNLAFTYFSDSTDAFVNAVAVNTPSVTNQLGQVKFSPAVSKGFAFENGDGLEASLTPELIYNFDTISVAGSGNLDPTTTGPQGLRGAVKLGMTYHTRKGISIDTSGTYDGIGTNGYSAITATARLSVPLN